MIGWGSSRSPAPRRRPALVSRIVGAFTLLGEPTRPSQEIGEAAWTLQSDVMWDAPRHRITRLVRIPLPSWWPSSC